MACFHPMRGWRSKQVNESGKRSLVFKQKLSAEGFLEVVIPCGQCYGCRLERSRQWAVRLMHEASLYDENCYLTLTYDDDHLPSDNSLHVEHYQKFMKRLRKKYAPKSIRFFHCGEYGDDNARPHYHAIIFNHDFTDKIHERNSQSGEKLYTSEELSELWTDGFSTIGNVTFESCAYVARYIMKKRLGIDAELHYQGLKPEYITMSRRPGIAKQWFDQWKDDVYPLDSVIINGKECKPPLFYDKQLEKEDPCLLKKLKSDRLLNMKPYADHLTLRRLRVSETIKTQQINQLKRPL